tara:strand:- start:10203 stop:11723 length:1521 start_codon:yes stop_codon:yes gene_type:complete
MNLANWLRATALARPAAPALHRGDVMHSDYLGFARNACSLARALTAKHGLKPGGRVALFMKNRVEYLELMYAVWWAGAAVVPINPKLHPTEAAWIAGNAEASLIFTDDGASFAPDALSSTCVELGVDSDAYVSMRTEHADLTMPHVVTPDDLAWLFYTSGTTGRPKGVMLSHANLLMMSLCYPVDVDPVSADDAILYAAPMSHGAGLYNFVHVRSGARHVVPVSRGFDAAEIFSLARRVRQVSMFAAPTMVKRMVEEAGRSGADGDGIKTIVYGGGPMYVADIIEAVATLGPKFVQIYGQGESPMTITALSREQICDRNHPAWAQRLASVGEAQSCVDVRIVDDAMKPLPPGVPGEIVVRGLAVMKGYWRNADATGQALVDGWLKTGDIGYLSEDGFLTLTDRSKDVIISGGTNVYPREVEEVLAQHSGVLEVSVVGQHDLDWGEIVVAFVVPVASAQLDADTLDQWCRAHMASFKKPKEYHFCEDLPKNSYGKILKTELRKRLCA